MQIRTGIDLVKISRFQMTFNRTDEFKANVFKNEDLDGLEIKTIAGFFAAKESVKKALSELKLDWNDIQIVRSETGKPEFKVLKENKIESSDLSISHEDDLVIANVTLILE